MIYITGDTHGGLDGDKLFNAKYINEGDYLIICGDFGYIWQTNPLNAEELRKLKKLQELPYTILFVDGNHENFDRLLSPEFEEINMFGSKVSKIRDNIYHLKRGCLYNIEDKVVFTVGGAMSTDKMFRREGISWWPEELLSKQEEEFVLSNAEKTKNIDYIITHAAPVSIVDAVLKEAGYSVNPDRKRDPVSIFLQILLDRISFRHWFCGHYHIDRELSLPADRFFHIMHDTIWTENNFTK